MKTPEEIAREVDARWYPGGVSYRKAVADAIAAERARFAPCVAALKTLRENYRNDSEHARLIDAALREAEGGS